MKKMKTSTILLFAFGAAILALGTVFFLTIPKEAWTAKASARRDQMAVPAVDGSKTADAASDPAPFPYRDGARRESRYFGMPASRRWRGGPGGLLFLALAVGMGAGFMAAHKDKHEADAKEEY